MLSLLLLATLPESVVIKETTLFKIDRKALDMTSIVISEDRQRYAYVSADQKSVVVDGKKYSGFDRVGTVTFSGDSKDWAFVAANKPEKDAPFRGVLVINGGKVRSDESIVKVVRAGSSGKLAWFEQSMTKPNVRLVHGDFQSSWCDRIDKVEFAPTGKTFLMHCRDRLYTKQTQLDGTERNVVTGEKEYFLVNGVERIERTAQKGFYIVPETGLKLALFDDGYQPDRERNRIELGDRKARFPGEVKGAPMFSSTGKTVVLRSEYTGVTADGNRQFANYLVNLSLHTELNFQTGFTFFPNSDKYLFCGYKDKQPHLFRSDSGPMLYSEVPGLQDAPLDLYKAVAFFDGKLILLFQNKKVIPQLFVEGKGMVNIAASTIYPGSLSVSPDGQWLCFGAENVGLTSCYLMNLNHPQNYKIVGKEDYVMDNPDANKAFWTSNSEFTFLGLRGGKLIRMDASIK